MYKMTHYVQNYTLSPCRIQYGKKFLSLEKFYTHVVGGVADYYQVWQCGACCIAARIWYF